MTDANGDTRTQATTGPAWESRSERTRLSSLAFFGIILVVLAVFAFVSKPWQGTVAEQEKDPVAVLQERVANAESAISGVKQAIVRKAITGSDLNTKISEEQKAEEKADADEATALNLKDTQQADEVKKKAADSRIAADNATRERITAEAADAEALENVISAQRSLRTSVAEKISPSWSPRFLASVVLFLLLASLFPLSAFAFRWLEVPALLRQLENDSWMLGKSEPYSTEGINNRWDLFSYALHLGPAVFATAVGVSLFFQNANDLLDANTLRGMKLGFLGAYIYSLNLVYRRYTTRDLAPSVYLSCAVGLIAGIVFNYVAFTAITNVATTSPGQPEFTGIGAGGAAILAFSLGFFPNLAIRWFGRLSRAFVHDRQRRSDALPLAMIDGISELHEARLHDEGIDNTQNLASADIQDLVEKTPYTAQEIVEWVDQAILYLYIDSNEIESFRRAGVRSVSDFRDVWAELSIDYKVQTGGKIKRVPAADAEFDERRKAIAQQLTTTEHRLDCLFRATREGPNMEHVRTYWANVQNAAIETRNLFINQVCGGVGRTLRESTRGETVTHEELLKQIAEALFLIAPDKSEVTAASLYGQGYLKNKLGRIAEARDLFEQCTTRFKDDPVAFNDLAWLDLKTRSQRSALEIARGNAQKAVDLAKKHAPEDEAAYLDTLALAEVRLGNLEAGVKCSQEAITKWRNLGRNNEPRFLETLVSAARAYLLKGNRLEATKVLNFVEAENYANEDTKMKIAELKTKLSQP